MTTWLVLAGLVALALILWPRGKRAGVPSAVPQLKGNGQFSVEVVGESFHSDNFKRAFRSEIAEDNEDTLTTEVAELRLDADNPHDANAVSVWVRGVQLGHLNRAMAADLRQALKRDGLGRLRAVRIPAHVYLGGAEEMFSVRVDLPEA